MKTPDSPTVKQKPPTIAAALIAAAISSTCLAARAADSVSPPSCVAMAEWAAKFDRNVEWNPNAIDNLHRFVRLFAD